MKTEKVGEILLGRALEIGSGVPQNVELKTGESC